MGTDSQASSNQTANKSVKPEVWVAIVGAIATIIVALLSFPPLIALFEEDPTSTPTATPAKLTTTPTLSIETPFPVTNFPLTMNTATAIATNTFAATPKLPSGMQVILVANKTSGRAPLKVNFDARESYLRDKTGEVFPCGACNYTWQIRQGSDIIFGPKKRPGVLEFTFVARGTYFVSVYVCRTDSMTDCGGNGAQITIR